MSGYTNEQILSGITRTIAHEWDPETNRNTRPIHPRTRQEFAITAARSFVWASKLRSRALLRPPRNLMNPTRYPIFDIFPLATGFFWGRRDEHVLL